MLSPFQQRKAALAFYRFDQTKNGLVRLDDFEQWGQAVATQLQVAPDSAHYANLLDAYRQVWHAFFAPFDRDHDHALTLDEFLAAPTQSLDPAVYAPAMTVHRALFDALDRDGDGQITRAEYTAFLEPLGVAVQERETAFTQLDRDGDGFLSREEFAQDLFDYFTADDRAAPGNWFFGTS